MTDAANFKVIEDVETGIVLRCYDTERADQFDDFLVENLDQEIYFKFDNECVSFFFGKLMSISEVTDLYKKFEKGIAMI